MVVRYLVINLKRCILRGMIRITANGYGFAMPCLRQRNLILTQNFIKMKNSPTNTFKHGIAKPMLPAVLNLTVKKEWFDLIKSGEKTEEYREIKEHWITRLTQFSKKENYSKNEAVINLLSDKNKFPNNWGSDEYPIRPMYCFPKTYTHIEFKNGYAKDAPTIITECKGIIVGNPTQKGSQLFDKDVFIISIGDIVWSNCG